MNDNNMDQSVTIELPIEPTPVEAPKESTNSKSPDGVNFYYVEDDANPELIKNMDSFKEDVPEEPKAKGRAKRKTVSIEEKIKSLELALQSETQRNQTLYEQYMQKENVQQKLQQQIQELNARLESSTQAQNEQISKNIVAEEKRIKAALLNAKNVGDYEAELSYTDQLAELKAKKHAYEAYRYSIEEQNARLKQSEVYVPTIEPIIAPPPRQQNINPHFSEWVQENPWYQNDPMLRAEADQVALELQKRLNLENSSHLIGTYEFFETVSDILKSNYNLKPSNAYNEPESYQQNDNYMQQTPTNYNASPSTARYNVAPPSRNPNMAQSYAQNGGTQYKNKITLTPEQRRMAHLLPTRHPSESLLDKEIRYAKALQADNQKPSSNNPFVSSPTRITF